MEFNQVYESYNYRGMFWVLYACFKNKKHVFNIRPMFYKIMAC